MKEEGKSQNFHIVLLDEVMKIHVCLFFSEKLQNWYLKSLQSWQQSLSKVDVKFLKLIKLILHKFVKYISLHYFSLLNTVNDVQNEVSTSNTHPLEGKSWILGLILHSPTPPKNKTLLPILHFYKFSLLISDNSDSFRLCKVEKKKAVNTNFSIFFETLVISENFNNKIFI